MANCSPGPRWYGEKVGAGDPEARVTIVSQVLTALLLDNSRPLDLSMSRKAFKTSSSLGEMELPILRVSLTLIDYLASAEMLFFEPHVGFQLRGLPTQMRMSLVLGKVKCVAHPFPSLP